MSKIFRDWCLVGVDLAFRDFGQLNFATFSVGGAVRLNFGKLLGYLVEFISRKEIYYLHVFIDISILRFWPSLPI